MFPVIYIKINTFIIIVVGFRSIPRPPYHTASHIEMMTLMRYGYTFDNGEQIGLKIP